ncbi:MAG TPA: site-2 protease family protein, partial [Nitrolancea sp.]|nr:site-2 protease family protein [Nitrolancea sp.]
LGGVTEDYNDPGTPLQDATIAIAGPVASLLLAAVLLSIWWLVANQHSMASHDVFFVAVVNLVLAVANLLPGYPLDGGRIFRALVWYLHDDYSVGTRAAVAYGQIISTFGLAFGLVIIGSRNSWSAAGLWVILAAWSVTRVGRQELTRSVLISYGSMLTAGEAVQGINPHARADQTLDDVIEVLLADFRSGPALVSEGSAVIGVISLAELRRYRRADWLTVRARDAMIPLSSLPTLDESASIRTLLREFADDRTDTLIITGSDGVVGAIDRRIAVEKLIDKIRGARRLR